MQSLLTPFGNVTASTAKMIVAAWLVICFVWWEFYPPAVIPKPVETFEAFVKLCTTGNLLFHVASSLELNIYGIVVSTTISLALCYASAIPAFKPVAQATSLARYMGLNGISFALTLILSNFSLKVALLTFGMTVFFVTSMLSAIDAIPPDKYRHAMSLGAGPWRTLYEVVIRGTRHVAFDIIRQNAAIGWLMLTAVEGLARSGGGLGVVLLNENKAFHLEQVFAIQFTVLGIALAQDVTFAWFSTLLFPYVKRKRRNA